MPRPAPRIPKDALKAGISTCLDVVGWRLREASAVLNTGVAPGTAAILFSFAVEEFGKAVLLHDACAANDPFVEVRGFYDHHAKLEAAAQHVPDNLLFHGGAFQGDAFQAAGFDFGNRADFDARLSGLYVDWRDGWRQGVRVDEALLRKNIAALSEIVGRKREEWT
jgi:AbiV family abortive infection protein